MFLRRFSAEVGNVARKNVTQQEWAMMVEQAAKAYVTWPQALAIAGIAAGCVLYDRRTQTTLLATNTEVSEVKLQLGAQSKDIEILKDDVKALKADVRGLKEDVKALKTDMKVLKDDVSVLKDDMRVLKDDVKQILKKLDAMGK